MANRQPTTSFAETAWKTLQKVAHENDNNQIINILNSVNISFKVLNTSEIRTSILFFYRCGCRLPNQPLLYTTYFGFWFCQYFCPIEMYVFNRAFKFGLGEGGGSRGTCDFLEGGMTRYGMSDLTADFHPPIQALI